MWGGVGRAGGAGQGRAGADAVRRGAGRHGRYM